MKQNILILSIAIISFTTNAQSQVDMKWKLNFNDTLMYTTVMETIDTNNFIMDFGGVFESIEDSTSQEKAAEAKIMLNEINKAIGNTQYAVRLFKSTEGHIEIEMFTIDEKQPINLPDTLSEKTKELLDYFKKMASGIVLRGSVNENGTIHSFWIKRAQKNLISLFFELPGEKVKIGDTWTLSTNLIGNDHNFICDSSYYKNKVKLIDIKRINGEKIAVLKYDLHEYVDGAFNIPNLFGKGGSKPTMMNFEFKGMAEFSLDKGRWVSYDGVMFCDATGAINTKQRIKYSLIEM